MIRMSKLADYGIVLMAYSGRNSATSVHTARELAERSEIPLPTVAKLLKALARGGLLTSQRGTRGGYSLALSAQEISVAEIITAIEGPPALTQCTQKSSDPCDLEKRCPVRTNWSVINKTVMRALGELTLADMMAPMTASQLQRGSTSGSVGRLPIMKAG